MSPAAALSGTWRWERCGPVPRGGPSVPLSFDLLWATYLPGSLGLTYWKAGRGQPALGRRGGEGGGAYENLERMRGNEGGVGWGGGEIKKGIFFLLPHVLAALV